MTTQTHTDAIRGLWVAVLADRHGFVYDSVADAYENSGPEEEHRIAVVRGTAMPNNRSGDRPRMPGTTRSGDTVFELDDVYLDGDGDESTGAVARLAQAQAMAAGLNAAAQGVDEARLHDVDILAELQDYRDGLGQLAYDPPAPGRPVEIVYRPEDEATYHQQATAAGPSVWCCACCTKLTVGESPERCAGCGVDADGCLGAVLTEALVCRSWGTSYDGPCLLAGSHGCECEVQR